MYNIPLIQSCVSTINGHVQGIESEVIAPLPQQIDALNQAATKIQQAADALDGHIRGIQSAESSTIPENWSGASANAASNAITTWRGQSSNLQQSLAGLKQPLNSIQEELQGLQKSLTGQKEHADALKQAMDHAQQQAEQTDTGLAGTFH
ncbi:MAG: WXG100 family type VII secretion target [Mycobacteriales bacterium]